MKNLSGKTLLTSGFQTLERGNIDELNRVLIEIGEDGVIAAVHRPGNYSYQEALDKARIESRLEELPNGTYLLPGLVDLHVHAPQYPQLGLALDVPLEEWLNKYTFPLEARYADADFARRNYALLVGDLLAHGTTTVAYFATIHEKATCILVDTCLEKGQRAIIGKVAMDNSEECPEYYRDESAEASVNGSRKLIDYIRTHPDNTSGLVQPAVTPRFIPSCSDEALEGLGKLAQKENCHVLTHCSESDWAHDYVLQRHGMTDTKSLDSFGLLGRKSILAHSVFLESDDMQTILNRDAAVAHCPLSNIYFANAVFPLKSALEKGLHVGLGTDISGGPNASLFSEMRTAIRMSRALNTGTDPEARPEQRGFTEEAGINFRDAFYIATTGGGIALDLPVGCFMPGYQFDAIAVDTTAPDGTIRLWEELDTGSGILQKIIYSATRPNIAQVWTSGKSVHSRDY